LNKQFRYIEKQKTKTIFYTFYGRDVGEAHLEHSHKLRVAKSQRNLPAKRNWPLKFFNIFIYYFQKKDSIER